MSLLALGMAASVAGTVAWFYTNDVTNAYGMSVKTHVPTSLFIEKGFRGTLEAADLYQESITYTANEDAMPKEINAVHMGIKDLNTAGEQGSGVEGQLDVLEPATWIKEPELNKAGAAATYASSAAAVLQSTASNGNVTPAFGANDTAGYIGLLPQSIVRKANSAGTYNLRAKVTISGIDGRHADNDVTLYEYLAIKAFRVGFLSSVDGGVTWSFYGQAATDYTNPANFNEGTREAYVDADTTDNGGVDESYGAATASTYAPATLVGQTSNETTTIYGGRQVIVSGCSNNTVIAVAPVMWIEGSDDACTALKYQNQYNWSIDIEYDIVEL